MSDIPLSTNISTLLPMADATVNYMPAFLGSGEAEQILNLLVAGIAWKAERIRVWGKDVLQPRLTAWYGDEGVKYRYSGTTFTPQPWTPLLWNLKERIEKYLDVDFNSVLLNCYRDHRDSMGLHSDDEAELGERPVIASLSLGAERTLVFRHKSDRTLKPIRLSLGSGSLLVMSGETQQKWKHEIPKEKAACGQRINLTFRKVTR